MILIAKCAFKKKKKKRLNNPIEITEGGIENSLSESYKLNVLSAIEINDEGIDI